MCLIVPQAKLAKRELDSAEQRVVTLRELLGDGTPELAEIQRVLEAECPGDDRIRLGVGEVRMVSPLSSTLVRAL